MLPILPKSHCISLFNEGRIIGVLKKKPIKEEGQLGEENLEGSFNANEASNPLGSEFKLTSEYFEKDIILPDGLTSKKGSPVTQVKVFRHSGIDVIDPLNLKEVIQKTRDIKQVIVEKISVDEATRVSLLFEPKKENEEFNSLLEERETKQLADVDDSLHKVFSIDDIENLVNENFLNEESSSKSSTSKRETPQTNAIEENGESDKFLKFNFPKKEEETVEKSSSKPKGLSLKTSLKLKDEEKKNVKYQKHTFTRKKAKAGHSYYYRAKDHVELYKVGSSYLKDFKSGLRSFSFSSKGLGEEREKTVLGILSFFNYHQDVNVCVVTSNLINSFYQKIGKNFTEREENVFDEDLTFQFFNGDGFDVVEFQELRKVERKLISYNFEDFLDFLLSRYDLILWDLPDRDVLDSNKELFFPIIRSLDNVSFIVGKNVSRISEINELISYYNRYQIPIKGLLFSDSLSQKGDKK